MFKGKKSLILLSLLLVLALTLTACGGKGGNGGQDADGPEDTDGDKGDAGGEIKDTIVIAQGAEPKSLDPHGSNDQPSSRVNKQMYNTLIESNEDLEIVPGLAKEWEPVDETSWKFTLEEGVKFHNGEELKASDVKFTFDRMKESDEVAHIVEPVSEVVVEDDYTVIIKTEEPFAPILAHLAHTAASILNEKAVTESGDKYHNEPVGTGPYKFVSKDAGDKVTLERFDDYFREPAKTKTLVFRNIPEGTNRAIGLETGEVDIAYDIEAVDKDVVTDHDDLKLIEEPYLSTAYIGFNTKKEPFDKLEVRKALNHAINVEEIIDMVLEGSGTVATGPINDKVAQYNKDLKPYEYDPEKAKEMLADAGYPDGFETTIWTNDSTVRTKIAEIVQANLKEIGVDAKIEEVEWGSYLDRTAAGEHDMFILGWVTVTADADYGLYALYHSSQHGSAGNRTFYTNEKVDALLEEGRSSSDEDERLAAYLEAQEIIVDEAPQLFLYFDTQNAGVQATVEGFRLHPAGHHSLYTATVK